MYVNHRVREEPVVASRQLQNFYFILINHVPSK